MTHLIFSFGIFIKAIHVCKKHESESEVVQSCLTLWDLWTVAHQAPPSMGFST